jgi:hypothetical protein
LDNHPERIENAAPVYFVPRPVLRDNDNTIAFQACLSVLRQIVALPGGRNIMNTHCVALYNAGPDGRVVINTAMERAWAHLGVINQNHPERIILRGKFAVYPGAKIMFTQNYTSPTSVSNGELCYVKSVAMCSAGSGGTMITVSDSQDDDDADAEVKNVLIHPTRGVAPHHIYPGYASTTYTAQGREFPYVIYWCPNSATLFTQRAHTYVATSRPRLALWVVGSQLQLSAVCRVPDRERQTCFRVMLRQMRCFTDAESCCATPCVYVPSPCVPLRELVCDENKLIPCVPVPTGSGSSAAAKKNEEPSDE